MKGRDSKGRFQKGHTPWCKGTKGVIKVTQETVDKIQASRAGYRHSEETKKKISKANNKDKRPKCLVCGKLITYGYKRCNKCKGLLKRGENHPRWKGGLPNCIDCGREISYYDGKRCQSCNLKFHSGEKHYNWKGGMNRPHAPSKDRMERVRFKREMQKLVLKRDNYTCQLCGVRGVDLQVDHIQPWAEYVELRFSMDNCRTLCAKCHYRITFGKPMPENINGWGHNLLERVGVVA